VRGARSVVLGALVLAAAAAVGAEVRRVEVPAAAAAGQVRAGPAELEAALQEAVRRVAVGLLREGGSLGDEEVLAGRADAAVGRDAGVFVVRYQVLGEAEPREGPPGGGEAPAQATRVSVSVDAARLAARLREAGLSVPERQEAPVESFVLTVLEPPSYAALSRLRAHLLASAGARRAVAEHFEPGRASLRVEAPGGAAALLARLRQAPPEGMRVEAGAPSADGAAIWLVELPGSSPAPPEDAPSAD
jgi:hypothetical protein